MAEQKQTYTVLVCERDEEVVEQMKQATGSVEWQVVGVAASMDKAVELAQRHKPDIVVMALTPGNERDGLAATRRIVTEQQTTVVILSADTSDAVVNAALEAGACAFLPTPLNMTEFVLALLLAKTRFQALQDAIESAERLDVDLTATRAALESVALERMDRKFGRTNRTTKTKAGDTDARARKKTEFIH